LGQKIQMIEFCCLFGEAKSSGNCLVIPPRSASLKMNSTEQVAAQPSKLLALIKNILIINRDAKFICF
jgi:hypothetical protein